MDDISAGIDKQKLYFLWKNCVGEQKDKINSVCEKVYSYYGIRSDSMEDVATEVRNSVSSMCKYFQKLWLKHYRNDLRVCQTEYFNSPFKLAPTIVNHIPSSSSGVKCGRKLLSFEDSSDVVKRRKTADIRAHYQTDELAYATQMKLREDGKKDAASVIKDITQGDASNAKELLTLKRSASNPLKPYSNAEALALILDLNLTKNQYLQLRKGSMQRNANLYPSYYKITEAKTSCYPDKSALIVTETSAEVKLGPLLEHTGRRIVEANANLLENFTDEELLNIVMVVKWGFDGTSGLSEYKMKFQEDDGTFSDKNVFVTSMVPIKASSNGKDLFLNKRPSSTRFCRPIRIQYVKETVTVTVEEKQYIAEQIDTLTPLVFDIQGRTINMKFDMYLTMVDGKAINSLTSTKSAQRCYICKATPTEMNQLDRIFDKGVDIKTYEYGLAPLHAKIIFFEYFLHLSYKLPVKKWRVPTEHVHLVEQNKLQIQQKFKIEMGLIVDQPRAGGAGTSNDGNTARRFFQNPEKAAEITKVNQEVIQRCAIILQTLASGIEINSQKFANYCQETAKKLVELYGWYYMPVTVHKVLIHGAQVIENFLVPIGQLSEEAQESRNKDLKRYRRDHTRKHSRTNINQDLLHRLLETSDPFLASLRNNYYKPDVELSKEVKDLLICSSEVIEDSSDSDEDAE